MEGIKCVPVAIITLNRYEHFKKCIESLRKNYLADQTVLYIGLDYPLNEKHQEGYNKIKKYIKEGLKGFREVIVIEQQQNVGVLKNFYEIMDKAFEKNDTVIFTEDDNEFSPNFLEYMNRTLKKFAMKDKCIGVCGYSYPIQWKTTESGVSFVDTFFSAWGFGISKKMFLRLKQKINHEMIVEIVQDKAKMKRILKNSRVMFCKVMERLEDYNLGVTDSMIALYMQANNMYCVLPQISKVKNCGFDGSGVNCIENCEFNYEVRNLDTNLRFDNQLEVQPDIYLGDIKKLDEFHSIQHKKLLKQIIKWYLLRFLGYERYKRLLRK